MAWDPATFAGPTGPSIPFQYTYFIILFAGVAFLAVLFGFGSPRGVGCLNYLCCSRCCTSTRRKGGRSSGGDGNSWNTSAGTATAVAPASENDDVEMSRMNPVEHDAPQPLQPQPQPGAAAADSAATAAAVPAVLPTTTSAARVTVTVLKILSRFSGVLAVFLSTTTVRSPCPDVTLCQVGTDGMEAAMPPLRGRDAPACQCSPRDGILLC